MLLRWPWSHLLAAVCSRCSETRVTTSQLCLFLDEASHTWASLQPGNCVRECNMGEWERGAENVQRRPGGETESMETSGKRRERGGKLNWVSNMRGNHNHLQRTSHTQTDKTGQWPWHLHKIYVIWFEIFWVSRFVTKWQRLCECVFLCMVAG